MSNLQSFLSRVKERLERATPGPWAWLQSAGRTIIRAEKPRTQADMLFMYPYQDRHESELWSGQDAELIAHAPQDITRLLQIVEVLREACAQIAETETIQAPDGRRWPLGLAAREALAQVEKLSLGVE